MPTTEHLNIPTYEQFGEHLRLMGIIAGQSAPDDVLDAIITATANGENTTRIFWSWFPLALAAQQSADRYALINRFFDALAKAWSDKTYTLRWYDQSVSSSSDMTPLDDLVGKTAGLLCTDASNEPAHWMDEDPMYWYIRANALSLTDGTMNILAFEGESAFDITGATAPVYTFKMAKWVKEWSAGSYHYRSWRATQAAGFYPYAADVDPTNAKRHATWLPTFPGGLDPTTGGLTSGAGLPAYIFASAETGIGKARITSAYEGLWCDCDTIAALHDWQFRHFNLENSKILEGCTSYNYDYTPAVAETGVERVILTTAQGANLIVGSTVSLTDTARASSGAFTMKKITAIEEVTISNTVYAAVYVDNGGTTFSPTTSMHLCTMPWHSGSTEVVPGHADGCIGNLTNGKYPIRVGGVEYMHGAYDIGLDPLYQVTAGSDANHFNYAVYQCKDSTKLASSVTANYSNTGITRTDINKGWSYVKEFVSTRLGILFPSILGGDGSDSKYYKSAFVGAYSAGVRCPWRFANLDGTGGAGLACGAGDRAPSTSSWGSRPRLSGAGKKRGEWAA